MKIVHVLPALTKGGGEKVAVELANHFAASGHDVTFVVAYPVDPALLQVAIRPDVKLIFVRQARSRLRPYLSMIPWITRHARWLETQDVIHCHLTFGVAFGATVKLLRRLMRRRRPAIVETCHAVGMAIPSFDRRIQAMLASRVDGFALMAEDDYWSAFVAAHPRLSAAVIPNGIAADANPPSEDERRAYREAAGIPADALVVGTVGRLVRERRIEAFVPIFAQVAREIGPKVHLLLAGEGSEIENLRNLVKQHGLEGRVHIPGLAMRPVLPFSIIDLYVSVNVGPVTGMAGLEAATFGLPIISLQMRDNYEPQPGVDWIYSSSDTAEVAAEAVRLLKSPAERRALAVRQNAYVRAHHSVDAMARSYEGLYAAALEEASCRP